jgi:hypothetical protein
MKNKNTPLALKKLHRALTLIPLILISVTPIAHAQGVSADALVERLNAMQKELESLNAQIKQLKATQSNGTAAPVAPPVSAIGNSDAPLSAAPLQSATMLGGYGELNYSRFTRNPAATQFNVRRIVLGVNHRFDNKTKLVTEIEIENAVTSATDKGEVAIEQAYIERQLNDQFSIRGGLFIVPIGFVNERHEPFAFYGVDRNLVETAIIPSTWREGGVMLTGQFGNGISVKGGVATGFDIGKWDASSVESKESPLRTLHQEGSLAKSKDLNVFGALDWRGVPGLLLGASVFSGKSGHKSLVDASGRTLQVNPLITVWDIRARYNPGKLDLMALYAKGSISKTAQLNASLAGSVSPIPSVFAGAYVQAAYTVWSSQDMKLTPFARFERVNTGQAFDLPSGLGRPADAAEQVTTLGTNFTFAPAVVIKADYQKFKISSLQNRFNLGLGYSF